MMNDKLNNGVKEVEVKGEDNMKTVETKETKLEVVSVLDKQGEEIINDINKGEVEMMKTKVYDLLKMTNDDYLGTLKTLFTRNFTTDNEKFIIEYAVDNNCRKMSSIDYGYEIGVSYKLGKLEINIGAENTDVYDPITNPVMFHGLKDKIKEIVEGKIDSIKTDDLEITYNPNTKELDIKSDITKIQILNIERKEIMIGIYGVGDVLDSAESISDWLFQN